MSKARDIANAGTALATVDATELGYLDGVTSAIQTQMDAKLATATASTTYVPNTLTTTTGDIIYASGADTPARLAVGSTDDVLTVAGGVPTWAAPAGGGGGDFTLLNTGGTALTGTTATTISGISGVNSIYLFIHNASSVNANANITVTFNADTSANYNSFGLAVVSQSTYTPDVFTFISDTGQNNLNLGNIPTDAAGRLAGFLSITGANTTNPKMLQFATGPLNFSGNTARGKIGGGYYIGASTISSLTVTSSSGNFDLGTIYVYTSAV
jgi:hypothetical protein